MIMEERKKTRGRPHIGKVFCKILRSKWALSLMICAASLWNENIWLKQFRTAKLKNVRKIQLCLGSVCQDDFVVYNGKNWSEMWLAEIPCWAHPSCLSEKRWNFEDSDEQSQGVLIPNDTVSGFRILKQREDAILKDCFWIFGYLSGNSL